MNYCVYTRFFHEDECINFFIEHYINLGFNKIIILKSDEIKYIVPDPFKSIVEIILVKNTGNYLLGKYDNFAKQSNCDWILSIDSDEFLLLHNKYKNINDYVTSKLLINNNINRFFFRWGMINKYDNEKNNNFKYILDNYKITENGHIKTMVKTSELKYIFHPHICSIKNESITYFEDLILYNDNTTIHPLTENSYNDCILVHIITRSINNIVIKSLNTILKGKKINLKNEFIKLINNTNINDEENNNLIQKFKETIGVKAIAPFDEVNYHECKININDFNIYNYIYNVIDSHLENITILKSLKKFKIIESKYFNFINKINDIIIKEKYNLFRKN